MNTSSSWKVPDAVTITLSPKLGIVIGGYIPGPHGFDSLIVGYYRGKDLVYVARVRNGFVPASRR